VRPWEAEVLVRLVLLRVVLDPGLSVPKVLERRRGEGQMSLSLLLDLRL
jgi:hypothetical protein